MKQMKQNTLKLDLSEKTGKTPQQQPQQQS